MLNLLLIAAGIYAAVCLVVFLLQERLVFFPGPPPAGDPGQLGLAFEEHWIATEDGERLQAWRVRAEQPRGTLLICNGNAGSIEQRLPLARAFALRGFDVLLFDWRGYGRSSGRPSELGLYRDADAAWRLLTGLGEDPRRIALYGESLGGAVAIELATRREVGALVLENSFSSLGAMGARVYPWLPARLLAAGRFDSLARIPRLNSPVMVCASPDDTLIPLEQGRELYNAATGRKRFLTTGGDHNDAGILQRSEWVGAVAEFLGESLGAR